MAKRKVKYTTSKDTQDMIEGGIAADKAASDSDYQTKESDTAYTPAEGVDQQLEDMRTKFHEHKIKMSKSEWDKEWASMSDAEKKDYIDGISVKKTADANKEAGVPAGQEGNVDQSETEKAVEAVDTAKYIEDNKNNRAPAVEQKPEGKTIIRKTVGAQAPSEIDKKAIAKENSSAAAILALGKMKSMQSPTKKVGEQNSPDVMGKASSKQTEVNKNTRRRRKITVKKK